MLIFEGNPDARWVSPHSEAGRAAAAKAALEDDASGSGSAAPVEDPGQMSMSPVQDDDSEDDFAPAKPKRTTILKTTSRGQARRMDMMMIVKATSRQRQHQLSRASLRYWAISTVTIARTTATTTTPALMILATRGCWMWPSPSPACLHRRHRRVGLAYDELMARHEDNASNHPERPERITMSYAELGRQGLLEKVQRIPPRRASAQELCRVHEARYVEATIQLGRRCDAIVREQNLRSLLDSNSGWGRSRNERK